MRETRQMPVPPGLAGMRVDAGLAKLLGLSRTAAAELAAAGDVQIDGATVGKSDRLQEDAWLSVLLPEVKAPLMPKEELVEGMDVLYHDSDLVAVHKPVGVAAHPSVGWTGPTVIGGLAAAGFRISTSGPPERQGIVQRLDVGTSGVMVVACSERGYSVLKRAFKNREVTKTYHALVQGHPDPSSGTIDAAIGRHPSAGWRFAVRRDGKPAVTHYKTLEAFAPATLLEVGLETGRTPPAKSSMPPWPSASACSTTWCPRPGWTRRSIARSSCCSRRGRSRRRRPRRSCARCRRMWIAMRSTGPPPTSSRPCGCRPKARRG